MASGLDVLRTRFELTFGRVRSDLPTLKSCLIMTGLCSVFFEEPEDERRLATLSMLLIFAASSIADASSDFLNYFTSSAYTYLASYNLFNEFLSPNWLS